jgi:HD-GYP domain-containing protein (c-di-GMP phosphodiesterase class II)
MVHPLVPAEPEALVEEARTRLHSRLVGRDRVATLGLAAAFLAATTTFALLYDDGRSPSALTVCLLVLLYAIASRVEFEVGAGTVIPTELVLVPMLFLLPLGLVPLYVALALLLGHVPDIARGRMHPERVAVLVGSARHALGPALVLTAVAAHGPRLSDWPYYVAALGAQFGIDIGGFLAREWLITRLPPRVEMGTVLSAFAVDTALAPIGFLAALATTRYTAAFMLVAPLLVLLAIFAGQRRTSIDRSLELGTAYRGTAFLLADVIEAKDSYTGAHSRQVVELVLAVADELRLEGRERRDAELAALLHDVGKMFVPDELIRKAGPLSSEERALINEHTLEGERMLRRVGGLLGAVGTIVRSCHERWDGQGYPDGVSGDEIPTVARIVAACDAYSAMTTDRSYRRALSREVAIEELRAHSGTQFDPAVVDALIWVLTGDRDPVAV